jgi:catechol 2,3-dioxygenase-like lactoylglutathione lyase family enzyme
MTMTRRLTVWAVVVAAALLPRVQGQAGTLPPATVSVSLPIVGLAQVTFKVSDLAKSRAYYDGVLGLPEAFTLRDGAGKTASVYFKINDGQFIEVVPTLEAGQLKRQERVVFESADLERLRAIYASRGLRPSPIITGPDGNPVFRIVDPEGNNLDFLQYVAGALQARARGKYLEPRRLTTHLLHAGIMIKDRTVATPFYRDKLGFEGARTIPGGRGEYVELPSTDRNLETKDPPLDPNNPATRDRYTREVYGAVYHVGLDVPDIRVVRDQLQQRGRYDDVRVRATVGNNRHWLIHVFDPDGSRSEFMEAGTQDLPAGTIMAPGPPAPPIPPATAPASAATPAVQQPGRAGGAAAPPAGGRAGGSSRYVDAVPLDPNDHTGWTQMFDGVTLKGWDGPTELWHVENGVIVVRSKADPQTPPTYLIWQGGEPKDFEFTFEVKLEGAGANSGTQFRATLLGEVAGNRMSKWETRGYQADIDNAGANTGGLIECCAGPRRGVPPRPDRAFRGQVVRTAVAPGATPTLLSTFDDPDALKNVWKVGDWNRLHLVARGRTMLFWINGRLMSVLIDDHPTMFVDHGVLAIQLEGRGENTASFRNLWIKELR